MRKYLIVVFFSFFAFTLAQGEIQAVDDEGNTVRLDTPAQRIVSLAPHITEMLFAVGAGERIVATVRFSDFPEASKSIPKIGSYKEISMESLVSLNPDLVIAWPSGNGDEIVRRLKNLELPVYLDEPREITDIADSLRRFGVLTGSESQANQAADNFSRDFLNLRSSYSEKKTVSVFYQVWDEPLTTLNGEHLISDVIRLCGGINVFEVALPLAPIVSVEAVLSADPQVIVVSGMGDERPDWLDYWKKWPALAAADKDQLYFIPPDFLQRSSPRIIIGAAQMCEFIDTARTVYR
jgi:iron complex transport system substrate-binding protein